jgi:hypothetical protein
MLEAVALMGMPTTSSVFWRRQLPHVPPSAYVLPWLAAPLLSSYISAPSSTCSRHRTAEYCLPNAVLWCSCLFWGDHQFIVHPHILASLDQSGHRADRNSQQFRKTLRIEAFLGLSTLILASFLGTTSPPASPPPHVDETFRQARAVDDARLAIEVRPLRPGPNEIRLTVTGHNGQLLTDATAALLQLQAERSNTAPLGVTLDRESAGVFVKKDTVLGLDGRWKG